MKRTRTHRHRPAVLTSRLERLPSLVQAPRQAQVQAGRRRYLSASTFALAAAGLAALLPTQVHAQAQVKAQVLNRTPGLAVTTDAQLVPQQTPLNILWEVKATPRDRMSTADAGEAHRFPMLGQTYYLPARNQAGTTALQRWLNAAGDHRSATTAAAPAGYQPDGTLGHAWQLATHPPGSLPLWSAFDSKSGDYALIPGQTRIDGYQAAALPDAYAYPRYGSGAPPLQTLVGKQITVASNLAAGGALWSLTWKGQQFVDQLDYGRLIQSSLSFSGPGASKALPTEGGDQTADADRNFMHGSPLLSWSTATTPQARTQSTRAVPLEWKHTTYNGGHAAQPVIYSQWALGKDITLDDTSLDLGPGTAGWSSQVMRYTTVFDNGGPALNKADIEIPTAYLRAPFQRGYTCDATQRELSSALREVYNSQYEQLDAGTQHYQFDVPAGGVIYANQNLTHALGVYGAAPHLGGHTRYFTLWKFGPPTAPVVTKWSAGAGPLRLEPGSNKFTSWIVVGTPHDVCAIMQRLYDKGLR